MSGLLVRQEKEELRAGIQSIQKNDQAVCVCYIYCVIWQHKCVLMKAIEGILE